MREGYLWAVGLCIGLLIAFCNAPAFSRLQIKSAITNSKEVSINVN